MSDEVGTNLVGAGQLVTCGTGFFSLAGKSGYSPRVIAALRARMRAMLLRHPAPRHDCTDTARRTWRMGDGLFSCVSRTTPRAPPGAGGSAWRRGKSRQSGTTKRPCAARDGEPLRPCRGLGSGQLRKSAAAGGANEKPRPGKTGALRTEGGASGVRGMPSRRAACDHHAHWFSSLRMSPIQTSV